jgi:hypothetical protein
LRLAAQPAAAAEPKIPPILWVLFVGFEHTGTQRGEHAGADVVSQRHGSYIVHAGNAELLAESERGGHDVTAWMPTGRPRIVGLIGMGHHAIRERRFDRTAYDVGASHRRYLLATVRPRELDCRAPRRQFGAGDHGGEGIEDVMLRLFDDILR